MGRKRVIGRDTILDAADQVIRDHGGHQLSLQLVAETANISKGAIRYNYRTKDELLLAVFARESARFRREATADIAAEKTETAYEIASRNADALAGPANSGSVSYVTGWISAARRENEATIAKAASLLTSILQSEIRSQAAVACYEDTLGNIDTATREGRAAFVAFMAVEGLFILRGLGALRITEEQWQEWLDIIRDTCLIHDTIHDTCLERA